MGRRNSDEVHARFLAHLGRHIPDKMTDEDMEAWMADDEATARQMLGFVPRRPLFMHVATLQIGPTEGCVTDDCFFGKLWVDRPRDFEKWLPTFQPPTQSARIDVLETLYEASYREWAIVLTQAPANASQTELERRLHERGLPVTLSQPGVLVKRYNRWVSQALHPVEPANYFFTANKSGGVTVVKALTEEHLWKSYLKAFHNESPRRAGCRVIVASLTDATLHDIIS